MNTENPLQRAKRRLGTGRIARICAVSREAARKWLVQGHLPRTDWTGETSYAALIAAEYNAEVERAPELGDALLTAEQLLSLRPAMRPAAGTPGGLAGAGATAVTA